MYTHATALTSELTIDSNNPRTPSEEAELRSLGENIKRFGLLVPLIVFLVADNLYQILDGHRRYYAAKLVGIDRLSVVVLSERPSEAKLRLIQMSLEAHKVSLTLMERSDLLFRIKREINCSVTELADSLAIKQPMVSKLLSMQKCSDSVKDLIRANNIDIEAAYKISQESDPVKQLEMANAAATMSREEFRQLSKPKSETITQQTKTARASFPLPAGEMISVSGSELTLSGVIESLLELVKKLKKGLADNLDLKTVQRVFRDKAQKLPA